LSSSGTIAIAMRQFARGRRRGFVLAWAATVALGAIFLAFTGREWTRLIKNEGLTPATNLFGTTYYSLVGLHAFHVTVGLLLLTVVLVSALAGKVRDGHREPIDALSLYWHFVDGVWVVVFSVVYLIGR
jgi:cytochrome c oxidase subunit 3/cytochrome o ubiquinol oxidase subunit 3